MCGERSICNSTFHSPRVANFTPSVHIYLAPLLNIFCSPVSVSNDAIEKVFLGLELLFFKNHSKWN